MVYENVKLTSPAPGWLRPGAAFPYYNTYRQTLMWCVLLSKIISISIMLLLFSLLFFLNKHLFCFILLRTLLIAIFKKKWFSRLIIYTNLIQIHHDRPPLLPLPLQRINKIVSRLHQTAIYKGKTQKNQTFSLFFSLKPPPPPYLILFCFQS